MFSLRQPDPKTLAASLASARNLPLSYPATIATLGGLATVTAPPGYALDHTRTLGLWTRNFPRILHVVDEPHRFGFVYGTTAAHVERGEERFLLEFDSVSGGVTYELLAASRPAHWMVWLGYPYARSRQRKFAGQSHARMRQLVADSV